MCESKCGKGIICTLYFVILLASSIFIFIISFCSRFSFPDNSIFKNNQFLFENDYEDLSSFPELEEIYKNYSNHIYYQRKYDLNNSYNTSVIPIFMLLSLIFGANLICCNNDKVWFIIIGILEIISQVIPFLNKLKSVKKRKEFPELTNYFEEYKEIFEEYEEYKKGISNIVFIIAIVLLGILLIIWFLISILKKTQNSDKNTTKQKCSRCSVMFYAIFGFISSSIFIFTPYLFYECKNRYSDYFLSNEYVYTKHGNIIETYNYVNYPLLKDIYDIYYEKSPFNKDKIIKVNLNFENLGIIYSYLAILLCPILIIVSFILLCCTKCNDKKCQLGFVIIAILSIICKLFIIFWPYYWIRKKYKEFIINDKEEIKHLIDDYINYSKCRKEFPIIIIIECFYLLLEITIIIVTICQNKYNSIDETRNTENIRIPIYETQENNNQNQQPVVYNRLPSNPNPNSNPNPSQTVLLIEREKIIREQVLVQQKKVKIKFKDNKNKLYEIEVETNRRFNDVLNELIGKYDMKRNEIKSITLGNKYLFLNSQNKINCLETIEQLNINENTGFIDIVLELPENNEILNINKLAPLPKLHFCIINLENLKIDVEKKNDIITFEHALENLQKKDKQLNNVIFESVFYYDMGAKIKLEENDFKKNLTELNIPEKELIFIKINYKDNTPVHFEFVWVNENNKRYNYEAGKKEKFHYVAMEFTGRHEEFLENIITQFSIYITDISKEETKYIDGENLNILATDNPNTFIKIIETELYCCFDSLEKLGIENGSEIFFMTRKNTPIDPVMDSQFRTTLRNSMIMSKEMTAKGQKILTFKTSLGDEEYIIVANEKDKFQDVLLTLKKNYKIFNELEIKGVMLKGNNLMREETREAQVKDLEIDEKDIILITVDNSTKK